MKLKILSLWQPHATLCITPSRFNPELPAKPVETRHWPTQHRGWLGIHSAMKKDAVYKQLANEKPFSHYIKDFSTLPFGYIIGMVYIGDCYGTHSLEMKQFSLAITGEKVDHMQEILAFGNFEPNRYGFSITDFVAFKTPIKASGAQGFWYYDMPDNIGARVKVWSEQYGTVLNYDAENHPYKYLIKHDSGKKLWYDTDQFTIIHKEAEVQP